MMPVTISALTFDPSGVVRIASPRRSTIGDLSRRISTDSTLDGTAAVVDYGVADADQSIEIEWQISGVESAIRRMMRLHGQVRVSTAEGSYLAALQRYTEQDGKARLILPVIRRLSA